MPFIGNTRNVVVLDSDSDAVSAARRAFHVWYDSMVHLWRAHGVELPRQVSSPDFDETVEQGYIVAGSPAKVRYRMLRDQSVSGSTTASAASPAAISRSRNRRARCACSPAR
jgi:hypothetical protein